MSTIAKTVIIIAILLAARYVFDRLRFADAPSRTLAPGEFRRTGNVVKMRPRESVQRTMDSLYWMRGHRYD